MKNFCFEKICWSLSSASATISLSHILHTVQGTRFIKRLEFTMLTSYPYKRTESLIQVRETQLTQWTMDEIHRTPNRCQVKHGIMRTEGLLSDSDTTGDHRSSQDSHLRRLAPRSTNHRIEPRPSGFVNRRVTNCATQSVWNSVL
jgi:hypothetical protein